MTRFGADYYEEEYQNQGDLWWANLARSVHGRKGQAVLRELREILVGMPEKRLISGRLADEAGHVCVVGAVALERRCRAGEDRQAVLKNLARIIPEGGDGYTDSDVTATVGHGVGLTYALAWRLGYLNDEDCWNLTPEDRYERVLAWVDRNLDD